MGSGLRSSSGNDKLTVARQKRVKRKAELGAILKGRKPTRGCLRDHEGSEGCKISQRSLEEGI